MKLKVLFTILLKLSFLTSYSIGQEVEKLSSSINSLSSELAPIVSADGKNFYFLRCKWKGQQIQSQKIWYSEKDENGNWKKSIKMEEPFNKGDINKVISISPDGNELVYFYGNYSNDKSEFLKLQKANGKWKLIGIIKDKYEDENQFKNIYWGAFSLSTSKKVGIISANKSKDMNDKYGEIYVTFLKGDTWSRAIKLGRPINVNEGEWGNHNPFLASDDKTLYFSSERKNGYGSMDIYMSKRLDDTWINWSEPVNLGAKINSDKFDSYYCLDASGEYAYFVSSVKGTGDEDIYGIKLPENLRPNPVVLISGKVLNVISNQSLEAVISYYSLSENLEVGISNSNSFDGSYKIVLPYGKKYSFLARGNGYYATSNYLDLTEISNYKELIMNIEMKPIEIGETFIMNNIFFDFNESTLRPESNVELDRVEVLLNNNPNIEIELSGHTDNIGTDEYNLTLSKQRADAVTNYLISKGINSVRVISVGYGKNNPVASNDTEEGRQLNRRVEFKILKK